MKRRDHETSSIPPNADAIDVGADLRRKLVELRSGEFSVAAPDRLQPGDLVAERYAIVRHLGRGAFCEVFEASDRENDGAACAIKVPRAEGKSSEELITRFRVEVRAASLIDSLHAASAFDAGLLDDGRPFYAMEFLRGLSLAGLLVRDDRVHPAHVAMIGIDILHALHEAHTRGIIHRDIKPSNALVVRHPSAPRPYARVIDFGIAKVLDSGDFNASMMNLTGDGRSPCTPLYAAPEQMRGSVTPKSDLYSLAMLLAALIEGYAPYGEHRGAMLISRQLDGGEVPWGRGRWRARSPTSSPSPGRSRPIGASTRRSPCAERCSRSANASGTSPSPPSSTCRTTTSTSRVSVPPTAATSRSSSARPPRLYR